MTKKNSLVTESNKLGNVNQTGLSWESESILKNGKKVMRGKVVYEMILVDKTGVWLGGV